MSAGIGAEAAISVTFFPNAAAQTKREEALDLPDLADRIATTTASSKVTLPWLKLATFGDLRTADKNSLRHNANVVTISGVEADYDAETIGFAAAADTLRTAGVAAIVYTSPSHTEDAPRWRVLCPLSKELPPEQRSHQLARLNGLFGGIFSTESWTLSQSYYYGSVNRSPSHRVELIEGTPIDLMPELDAGAIGKPVKAGKGNGAERPISAGGSYTPASDARLEGFRQAVLDNLRRKAVDGQKHIELRSAALALGGIQAAAGFTDVEAVQWLMDALPPSVDDWTLAARTAAWGLEQGRQTPIVLEDRPRPGHGRHDHDANPHDIHQPNGAGAAPELPPAGNGRANTELHDDQPEFFDPWADPPPPEFPGGVLTREMEDTVFALAMRDGVCPGALAMAYLAAVSGAAPKAARFTPYQNGDWSVPPIVWVMTIADSGQRKTAIEDRAFVALREEHAAVWRAHRRRLQEWQALPADERRNTAKPEEPHSFLVEDVTPEKLQMILAATDRGTFMVRDEMAGLFEFGRYGKNTGAAERAFYLQAYEGGQYTVSRVSRDSLHIGVNALTIYGSIQPDRLKDFPDLAKDGLLQRINMIRTSPASASRDNVAVRGVDKLNAAISALTRREAQRYRTSPAASDIIRQTERDGRSYATLADYGPGFQGTCSKLHGTHARWTLILHLLDDPDRELIPQATVERAAILIREFLLPQARDFFANLAGSPQQRLRDAAGWILTRAPMRFLASNLTAGVWSCRGISTKDLGDLLDPLVTGGWLDPETPFPSNRAWIITPNLRAAFAARAETEGARREEARRLFQELGKPYVRARP